MDKKYLTLFKDLAQATAASAEQVMDYDREKDDAKGLATATVMRDDYQDLTDRLSSDDYIISKSDAAKLLVGAMIQMNQLQDRIANLKKAMTGYQTDVMPKLQALVDAAEDVDVAKLADEKFIIENEN